MDLTGDYKLSNGLERRKNDFLNGKKLRERRKEPTFLLEKKGKIPLNWRERRKEPTF